jgi:hypothetical protein
VKWNDRQEDGSIDQTHEPLNLIRCVGQDLGARIQNYEMRVGNDRFTNDSFSAHLKAKLTDANVVLSIDQAFGNV